MKKLKDYIIEGQNFLVNKKPQKRQDKYEYHPKNKDKLYDIIIDLLKNGQTNLNCIDVSNIDDMSLVFHNINNIVEVKDIDISEWDVSNVTNMYAMFYKCKYFNSDLSSWNVSNVGNMFSMFARCEEFNSDLSRWDVSKVKWMNSMFYDCKKFNSDLSNWDVSNVSAMLSMFEKCDTLNKNNKIPAWYSN